MKTFKEYMGGFRVGYVDNITPMVSLGDTPPKGQGGKDSRGVGLNANYTTQGVGTIKPMLTADAKAKQQKNWKDKGFGPYKLKQENQQAAIAISKKKSGNYDDKGFRKEPYKQSDHPLKKSNKERESEKQYKDVKEDAERIPRKPGQKVGSDKHSDLYTDENPKGTIHGLGFTDAETARTSVNKIKNSGKTHAHKIQAAIAMSQRAKVASERAKDPKKKKDLGAAHRVYQSFIDTNKKKD